MTWFCIDLKAIADIEKAIVETLDRQFADVLSPLKENLSPIKFGIKYVQKIATGTVCPYTVPEEVSYSLLCKIMQICPLPFVQENNIHTGFFSLEFF